MMFALIRKEWRLNRAIFIGCLVTMVMPYVISVANLWISPPRGANVEPRDYMEAVKFAAFACLMITVILAAAFGGQTFAGERRERTAEFMAMLPVSRGAIIAGKLAVPALCLATLIVLHVVVLCVCGEWAARIGVPARQDMEEGILYATLLTVGGVVLFFGIAWALSLYLRSPAIAASISLGVGIAMSFGMLEWGHRGLRMLRHWGLADPTSEIAGIAVIAATAVIIGAAAIGVSGFRYRRRIEP